MSNIFKNLAIFHLSHALLDYRSSVMLFNCSPELPLSRSQLLPQINSNSNHSRSWTWHRSHTLAENFSRIGDRISAAFCSTISTQRAINCVSRGTDYYVICIYSWNAQFSLHHIKIFIIKDIFLISGEVIDWQVGDTVLSTSNMNIKELLRRESVCGSEKEWTWRLELQIKCQRKFVTNTVQHVDQIDTSKTKL